jgi:cytochrome P450
MNKITNNLPKGPTGNKFLLTMKAICQPIALFEECRRMYGKTFTMPPLSGYPITVFVSDPADLKQVFSANANQLNTGESSRKLIQPILGDFSLLSLDGKQHLHHRKLLLPPFHGPRMAVYGELMATAAQKKIAQWKKSDMLKLEKEAREITFHVILKAIFGMDEENARFEELTESLHTLVRVMSKPFSFLTLLNPKLHRNLGVLTPWAKMMKWRQKVDNCLFEEIEARKKMNLEERTDILSLLLQARDEEGNLMTNQEIRDEMLTLLMAGHETSTMGIAWAFYGILSNTDILNKLKEELTQVVSNENGLVKNLDKLVYLDAVLKEALRISPVIPYVGRITNEPYQLGEYLLPKGAAIAPSIYLAHRDPDVWSEPDKFIPERFLNSSDTPYTYLPFGGGIRRCIGAAFAQYEMKIIIAQILLHTELELKENYVAKFQRKGAVIAPSKGLPVIVKNIMSF